MENSSKRLWLIAVFIALALLFGCDSFLAARLGTETPVSVIVHSETPPAAPGSTRTATRRVSTVITIVVSAATTPRANPTPSSSFTPKATLSFPPNVSLTSLKYALIEHFGKIFFCDPDLYPVAHEVSDQEIAQRVAAVQQNPEEYQSILEHLGLSGLTRVSAAQNRLIDSEDKRLNAILMEPAAQGYLFHLCTSEEGERGFAIEGTISRDGTIALMKREPTITTCPICLAGSTMIDTPQGAVPVRTLRNGMPVWTVSRSGNRELAVVLATARRPVPRGVLMVQLVLDDGRDLVVSAGHPTFAGQLVGDLVPGDILDGANVVTVKGVFYTEDATYDILPSGETGAYRANGILLSSTLAAK